jgi:predicted dehydrogenase
VSAQPIGVAVVGAGYWGRNLVRTFANHRAFDLKVVCDVREGAADEMAGLRCRATTNLDDVLGDPAVQAVALATPPDTHEPIGLAVLQSGRHLLVEKPMATSLAGGLRMAAAASAAGRVLMCDHTYCYSPAVAQIRDLIASGSLGEILFVDSVRINLGLIQSTADVFWDLAPHDLAILDFVLPAASRPASVSATGSDPLGVGVDCVGYLTMRLPSGSLAHAHLNWLSPTKIRRFIVGGDRRMVVWDDLDPSQRLTIYDKGIDSVRSGDDLRLKVSYRVGGLESPALPMTEPLVLAADEFASAIREARPAATDAASGLRVLAGLEAIRRSLAAGGTSQGIEVPT